MAVLVREHADRRRVGAGLGAEEGGDVAADRRHYGVVVDGHAVDHQAVGEIGVAAELLVGGVWGRASGPPPHPTHSIRAVEDKPHLHPHPSLVYTPLGQKPAKGIMNVVLISTYELGHQPFGLASPAAWLKAAA